MLKLKSKKVSKKETIKLVNIKINGYSFKAPSNQSILQTCLDNNIIVPSFCYHGKLGFAGNCRMCLVEIAGSAKPIISCIFPVNEGMTVRTETPAVKKARESILEFLLLNHPLDCPICDQAGECDLQEFSYMHGSDVSRDSGVFREASDDSIFSTTNSLISMPDLLRLPVYMQKGLKLKNFVGNSEQLIGPYMSRCILCTKCIRFERNISGNSIFGVFGRGSSSEIRLLDKGTFLTELSGNTIDLCPVGALTSRNYAFKGRPWDLFNVSHMDVFDNMGTDIEVGLKNNQIIRISAKINNGFNEEWVSDKIRYGHDAFMVNRLLKLNTVYTSKKYVFESKKNSFLTKFLAQYTNVFVHHTFKKRFEISNLAMSVPEGLAEYKSPYMASLFSGEMRGIMAPQNRKFTTLLSFKNYLTILDYLLLLDNLLNKKLVILESSFFSTSSSEFLKITDPRKVSIKTSKFFGKILNLQKNTTCLYNFKNLKSTKSCKKTVTSFKLGNPSMLNTICTFKHLSNLFGSLNLIYFLSNDFIEILPKFLFKTFKPSKKFSQQNIFLNLDLRVTHPVLNSKFYVLNRNGLSPLQIFGNYTFFNYKFYTQRGLTFNKFLDNIICKKMSNDSKVFHTLFWEKKNANIFFDGTYKVLDYINNLRGCSSLYRKFSWYWIPRYQNTFNKAFLNFNSMSNFKAQKFEMLLKAKNYNEVQFTYLTPANSRRLGTVRSNTYCFNFNALLEKDRVLHSDNQLISHVETSSVNKADIPVDAPYESFYNTVSGGNSLIEKPSIVQKMRILSSAKNSHQMLLDDFFFRNGFLFYYMLCFVKSFDSVENLGCFKKSTKVALYNQLFWFKESDYSLTSFYGERSTFLRKARLNRLLSRNNFGKNF